MLGACASARCASASVRREMVWSARVPLWMMATGVPGFMPAFSRSAEIFGKFAVPMSTTSVAPVLACADQSTLSFGSSQCPVTTVTARAMRLWVTGIPAIAGTENADEIPGTISKETPALMSASASSPPRPNTNGSPPFRRTTC